MRVLGIETSCDETGVAIYDSEKGLIADQLYTQIAVHADYGGVVPELASRDHIRKTLPLIKEALKQAKLTAQDIDGIAYTAWTSWSSARWLIYWSLTCLRMGCSCDCSTSYGRSLARSDA